MLLVVVANALTTSFLASSINVALPRIGTELGIDAVLLSWIVTLNLLAAAVGLIPFGRISDIYGRKKIFTLGLLTYGVSIFLAGNASSVYALIFFRILEGFGTAMSFSAGLAMLTSVFPVTQIGKAVGMETAAVFLGHSSGPFLGGLLTQHFGWRSVFLVATSLSCIAIGFLFWKVKGEWREAKGERVDVVGSVIYGFTLLAVIYGVSLLPEMEGVLLIFLGVLGIVSFIKWESKEESPILDITLFRKNRVFASSNLVAVINFAATYASTFLFSLYLQYIKGMTPQDAGLILVFQQIARTIVAPVAGSLADRVKPRTVSLLGMVLMLIALSIASFLEVATEVSFIVLNLFILGLGGGLFFPTNMKTIMSCVEKRFYGVASGTRGTMRSIGQIVSMSITSLLFTIYIGRVQITPEYYPIFLESTKTAFIVFTVLCVVGIIVAFKTQNRRAGDK